METVIRAPCLIGNQGQRRDIWYIVPKHVYVSLTSRARRVGRHVMDGLPGSFQAAIVIMASVSLALGGAMAGPSRRVGSNRETTTATSVSVLSSCTGMGMGRGGGHTPSTLSPRYCSSPSSHDAAVPCRALPCPAVPTTVVSCCVRTQ